VKKNPHPLPPARIKNGNKLTHNTKNYKKEKKKKPMPPCPLREVKNMTKEYK